jgi:glycosyltransferase involved in cell wall biosynthesis
MTPRISVVVCTHNRAAYLLKALKSLSDQTLQQQEYEILVVDNASTDNTRDAVVRCTHIKNLRYLYESVLGLSQARNTGWRNSAGKYVAYLDDDAVASRQWLKNILDAFEGVEPKPGCVGGDVEPIWEAPRPSWLADAMLHYLTVVDWSKTPITLRGKQWLAGTNFAIPKFLLERIGGFETALGRQGSKLLSNDEILIQRQVQSMGFSCYYHPDIAVRHHVPASRLSKKWFYARAFWQGASHALIRIYQEPDSVWLRLDIGARSFTGLLLALLKLAGLAAFTNEAGRFALTCGVIAEIGCISALLGRAK